MSSAKNARKTRKQRERESVKLFLVVQRRAYLPLGGKNYEMDNLDGRQWHWL